MSSEPRQPSEEELRAAYEAELKRLRVEHVLLDNVVALVNIGMRRTGLVPDTEDERDPDQVRMAIEAIRALLPLLEQAAPAQIGPIREAVSQLQMAYVRMGGQAAGSGKPGGPDVPGAPTAGGPGAPGTHGPAAPGTSGPAAPGTPGTDAPDTGGGPGGAPDTGGGPGGAPDTGGGPGGAPEPPPAKPGEPGPAQRSGRLWVPGQ